MLTSSIAVSGAFPLFRPCAKTWFPFPEEPYGIAKLAVEHELRG